MYNLDAIGLILLFVTLIIAGGLYLVNKNKKVSQRLTLPVETEDTFETAEELLPDIEFPPEVEPEYVPELPIGYGDNKIVIMARDPEWIFAYWDVDDNFLNSLRQTYGAGWDQSLPTLRVYDVTGVDYFDGFNANSYYDVIINDFARSWYLKAGLPDRVYCVDLGRTLDDGTFVVISRSNFTFTPRNSISDRADPEWMMVSEYERKLYARIGQKEGFSSADLFKN